MKYFDAEKTGRTFVLRMERGDLLRETIFDLCQKENINTAVVLSGIATFDIVSMQMTNSSAYPITYDEVSLNEPLELASLDGTIINKHPHLHGTIGNATHTWAGHILDGCRILYLGEIVIQEICNDDLIRKPDENGVNLIYSK